MTALPDTDATPDLRTRLQDWLPKLVLSPSLVAVLIFVYGFIGFTVWVSFTNSRILPFVGPSGEPAFDFIGLSNYEKLFRLSHWEIAITNLGVFAGLYIIICCAIGLMLAIFLDQKIRGEGVLRPIYLYPMALSFIVTGTAWKWFLDPGIGRAIARLGGWSGARLIQDNVIWKPPGARSLGYHRDNAYLAWYRPREMLSCWIALDETTAEGGTMELVKGSHNWPMSDAPQGAFHAPEDHRAAMMIQARALGLRPEMVPVTVPAGGGSFHHGWTWHGSGPNLGNSNRRSLVIHAAPAEARFDKGRLGEGNGPIYGRYRHLYDDEMDENHFPILWREDGYRTPQIADYLEKQG